MSMHSQENKSCIAEEPSDSQKGQAREVMLYENVFPPWIELPIDVTANILRRLSPYDILYRAEWVCATWQRVCKQPSFWRVLHMKGSRDFGNLYADGVFRQAVYRSKGELINVKIRHFGNDDTLLYVTERSRRLKILCIQSCDGISPQGLTEAVKNTPHLEELHLFNMSSISSLDIENIGVSCPMLKSFILSHRNRHYSHHCYSKDDSVARSIAGKMPNLVRLCLYGNMLSKEGMLAILNGCPNLESLDLRECYEINLQQDLDLGRCSEQIKGFRCVIDWWRGDRFCEYNSDDDLDCHGF